MISFAHRGASAKAVQNTVAAFQLARQLGATCYELDVHLTQDGVLVVHHDYSLLSTAGTDVRIKDIPFAALQKYPLHNPFDSRRLAIPCLEEVLPALEPGLELLNVELKNDENHYPGLERKLLSVFNGRFSHLLPKTLFSSFDYETLARIRKLDKNARIGLLTRSFDISAALGLRAESVHMNYTRFTPEIARVCHENGLNIYLYTVNDAAEAQRLEGLGADGIFTDRIDLFV